MFRSARIFLTAGVVALAACSGSDSTAPGPSTQNPPPGGGGRASVASVLITPTVANVLMGNTTQLTAVARDSNNNVLADRVVTWSSSAVQTATVNAAGMVTGVAEGAVLMTAASEGKSVNATVNVMRPAPAVAPVATIAIGAKADTIEAWDVLNMQTVTRDSINQVLTGRAVQWTSSNAAVATINATTGVLTGINRGTVTITATSEGKSASVSQVVVIRYRSLTTGTAHACNIASGGIVWCWGQNGNEGRIGSQIVGAEEFISVPVMVPGNHRFTQVATYGRTTCGLRVDGKALCWGSNNWGVMGQPSNIVSASIPQEVAGNISFRSLAAGGDQMCGISVTFLAYCWGNNQWGQFGDGKTASNYIPQAVNGGVTLSSITAGSSYTCGVTAAFAGFCWGADGAGQHGNGMQISNGNTFSLIMRPMVGPAFTSLSASNAMTCGVTAPGTAYCFGSSTGGRLGSQGSATSTPRAVAGGLSFRNLSVGAVHVCGVTLQFEVHCWGMNGNGQLGLTLLNGSVTPVRAGGTLLAAEVAAANISTGSAAFTCAESKDRLTTYCWGRNDYGQLGNGANTTSVAVNSVPSIVVGQKPL
ncbi:MAG: Ig-like domain-containing protein [Phycisphaerae bacterium]|nr:Ig-like domain-containing protein [Gemmatimonadaceae bacterium]